MSAENPFKPPSKPPTEEEHLRRRLTRLYTKTTERMSEGTYDRLERFEKKHPELISVLKKKEPVFYDRRPEAGENLVFFDEDLKAAFPEEFFEDPTGWIEELPTVEMTPDVVSQKVFDSSTVQTKDDLETRRYGYSGVDLQRHEVASAREIGVHADLHRVKFFRVSDAHGRTFDVVSKRVNPKHADFGEAAIAMKAREAGIPTPRVLALIEHHGNMYAFFERVPSHTLSELYFDGAIDDTGKSNDYLEPVIERFRVGIKKYWPGLAEEQRETYKHAEDRIKNLRITLKRFKQVAASFRESVMREGCAMVSEMHEKGEGFPKGIGEKLHARIVEFAERERYSIGVLSKDAGLEPQEAEPLGLLEMQRYPGVDPFPYKSLHYRYDHLWFIPAKNFVQFQDDPVGQDLLNEEGFEECMERLVKPLNALRDIQFEGVAREPFSDAIKKQIRAEADKIQRILAEHVLGDADASASLDRACKRLIAQCKELGIEHKDYGMRNILVELDPLTGQPMKDESGDFKLQLIDWEQHEKGRHKSYRHSSRPPSRS